MSNDDDQRSASVPVESVVTGDGVRQVAARARLIAYRTAAQSGGKMQLTRVFRATIKGFNADYGQSCRTWSDVLVKVTEMIKEASK